MWKVSYYHILLWPKLNILPKIKNNNWFKGNDVNFLNNYKKNKNKNMVL